MSEACYLDICVESGYSPSCSELARAAVDHHTSVAPNKRTPSLNHKSLGVTDQQRSRPVPIPDSTSMEWTSEEQETWVMANATAEGAKGRVLASTTQPPAIRPSHPPVTGGSKRDSSTDASGEDIPSVLDLRASGSSLDSADHGGADDVEEPLRILAPANLMLSRDSSCAERPPMGDSSTGGGFSSPLSAESDTDLLSPVGFWQENFETIDARNATRRFSGWGDNGSVGEISPDACSADGEKTHEDWGGNMSGGGGGHPQRQDTSHSRALRDPDPTGIGVSVGRKLFVSPEDDIAATHNPTAKSGLASMAEGFDTSLAPTGRPPHTIPFWATVMEPVRDTCIVGEGGGSGSNAGGSSGGNNEKEPGAVGWRRGEAGLVVPEVRSLKGRSVTIQQIVPQRVRAGDSSLGADAKATRGGPRPTTTSPTLSTASEHKSATTKKLHMLSDGVKITRSYSYHGLGSMALYDAANRG